VASPRREELDKGRLAGNRVLKVGAVELKASNFDAEVKNSGKNAFIKFLAPW
jgi:hypothetical protein